MTSHSPVTSSVITQLHERTPIGTEATDRSVPIRRLRLLSFSPDLVAATAAKAAAGAAVFLRLGLVDLEIAPTDFLTVQ